MAQQHRSKVGNVSRSLLGDDVDDGKGWKKKLWCSGCKQTWSVFKATQNLNLSYWCWNNILIYNCNHQLSHLNQSGLIEGSPALSTFIRQAFDFQYGFGLAKSSRAASAWVIQHSSDWKWRSCRSRTNNSCPLSDRLFSCQIQVGCCCLPIELKIWVIALNKELQREYNDCPAPTKVWPFAGNGKNRML